MIRQFFFILIISVFISCSKSVKFEPKNYNFISSKDTILDKNFGITKFQTLYTENQSNISDSVNKHLIDIVKENLFQNNGFDTITTYKGMGNQFIQEFFVERKKSENKNISSYQLNISHVLSYQSEKLLNFQVHFKKDHNEIHNYFGVLSLLIEKETGRKLPCHKLFKDKDLQNVIELCEIAFREKFKIEFGDSYNKNGFFFRNNKFELPEHIFLVKEGVLFVYNPYEISSISKGNVAFQIPYKEIGKYMAIR